MGTRHDAIVLKLTEAFAPDVLRVENESKNHSVPAGSETHFKVVVVSSAFEGVSRVDRHRKVNAVLAGELSSGLHALTITSRTPAEWATTEGAVVAESPPCLGGGGSKAAS
jgi:BolA protein